MALFVRYMYTAALFVHTILPVGRTVMSRPVLHRSDLYDGSGGQGLA